MDYTLTYNSVYMLTVNGLSATLDFIMAADKENVGIISFYDRSLSIVKSIGATLSESQHINQLSTSGCNFTICDEFSVIITPIIMGKDKFYHAIAINKKLNTTLLLTTSATEEENFFHFFMNNYNLPLLRWWSNPIINWCKKKQYIVSNSLFRFIKGPNFSYERLEAQGIYLKDMLIYKTCMSQTILEECIKDLFSCGAIYISKQKQNKLMLTDMDTYFKEYGKVLVKNLENIIEPLTPLNGNIDRLAFNNMRMYPQQAAQVNGVLKLLRKSNYAILNEGMGTGKVRRSA